MTETELALVLWSARVSVLCYLTAIFFRCAIVRPKLDRGFWTGGFLIFVIHLFLAFHFVHHWSHADAWNQTAKQTQELTGLDSGIGVWFNYLFALVWGVDVVRVWMKPDRSVSRLLSWTVQGYLAFIVFNATVVFGHRGWWIVLVIYALLLLFFRRKRQHDSVDPVP